MVADPVCKQLLNLLICVDRWWDSVRRGAGLVVEEPKQKTRQGWMWWIWQEEVLRQRETRVRKSKLGRSTRYHFGDWTIWQRLGGWTSFYTGQVDEIIGSRRCSQLACERDTLKPHKIQVNVCDSSWRYPSWTMVIVLHASALAPSYELNRESRKIWNNVIGRMRRGDIMSLNHFRCFTSSLWMTHKHTH